MNQALVEVGAPAARQSDGAGHDGVSLPAGHEQVEQDRASPVLAYRDELAGHPAHRSRDHRQPDRLDAQPRRPARPRGTRPRALPGRCHRDRCAAGDRPPRTPSVPRRLELYDSPPTRSVTNFLTGPKRSRLIVAPTTPPIVPSTAPGTTIITG